MMLRIRYFSYARKRLALSFVINDFCTNIGIFVIKSCFCELLVDEVGRIQFIFMNFFRIGEL